FRPLLKEKGYERGQQFLEDFCRLVKEKVQFVHEFWDHGKYVFEAPVSYEEKVIAKKWKSNSAEVFNKLADTFAALNEWNVDSVTKGFHETEAATGKIDMQLLRVLVSGVAGGPQLFD